MSKIVVALVYPATQDRSVAYIQHMARVVSLAYRSVVGTALVLTLVVALQLAYPRDRTRPFLKISDMSYGFVSAGQLTGRLQALDDQTQTLKLAQKTYQTTANRMGMNINTEQASREAISYTWKQRLVPFSFLSTGDNLTPKRQVDEAKLSVYIDQIVAENTLPAKNAQALKKPDGLYALVPAKQGVAYEKPKLKTSLSQLPLSASATMELSGKAVVPAVTDEKLQQVINQANTLDKQDINITFGGQQIKLAGVQLKAWAAVSTDETKGTAQVNFDQAALEAWLRTKAPLVTQAATPSLIYTLDGAEQSQKVGKKGQALDTSTTAQAIMDAARQNKSEVKAAVVAVAPGQKIIRAYSPTSIGVAALIKDWQAERKNAQTAVYFQEIDGKNRSAEASSNVSYFAASLYKLFVAYFLLNGIQAQTINPTDQATAGKDINACIHAMIVVSDNVCPQTLADRFGWGTINSFMQNNGFGASSVKSGNNTVTAASVGDYLKRLQAGGLLDQAHTNTLLGYMGQQKYRSGIPAGVPGITVQDKPGFYGGSWHDAAIVHSQKATYILVVLTKGSSPAAIADLTKRIDAIL